MSQKMKAVIINAYGGNEVLQYLDIACPTPQADEVLIKVRAAGVNPVDWKIRDGAGQRLGMTLPIHLGNEVSGTVQALGADVRNHQVGDGVFCKVKFGGFAEYVVVKAVDVVPMPANLDFINAAAIPLGALTAWQSLFDAAQLSSGQKILITSTSGGVGSLAVQLAKAKGAHVTGVASGRNAEFVRRLGVDDFIDYEKQNFEEVVKGMDVVFDTMGGDTFQKAFRTLKTGGCMVTVVAFPNEEATQYGMRVHRVITKANGTQLTAIRDMVESGNLQPHVSLVLPLAGIKEALELSAAGRTRGKIVLDITA